MTRKADQMMEAWVNAVIEVTVPLDDVAVDSESFQKQDAVGHMMERLTERLGDDLGEFVASGHWEDSVPDA